MSQMGTDDSMSDDVFEDDSLRAPAQRNAPSPTGYRDYQPPTDTPARHYEDDMPLHKTILLGDSGVGKTSLLVQFETGKFQSGNFSATVGIGFTRTTPAPPDSYPGSSGALRRAFSHRGTPPTAIPLMLASLSNATLRQYGVCYKLWWRYCQDNNADYFTADISHVITFMSNQFDNGASYGTLNSHRSALALLLGNNLSSDDSIKRLIKGVFKLRPAFPKYTSTWDPQVVLNYVSEWMPNGQLTLEKITKKLVVLLALSTAHRVQTFSLIKISSLKINKNGIEIFIKDIIKTSGVGRNQPVLYLPFFRENTAICPATTLVDYLSLTKDLRPAGLDHLLITVKRPHRNATAQSISRWIKQTLCASGVDVAVYGAHSARHAATSAARAAGLSLDLIRKTAGWSESSQTFAKYYNRPIVNESDFAKSVCIPSNND